MQRQTGKVDIGSAHAADGDRLAGHGEEITRPRNAHLVGAQGQFAKSVLTIALRDHGCLPVVNGDGNVIEHLPLVVLHRA